MTDVSGVISTNTTWTKANSPYNLTGTVEVRNGATLTIESGVTVTGSDLLVSDNGTGGRVSAASGVTFSNRLLVYGPGTASLSGDTFNNYAEFQLYDGGGGTTLSGNTFKGGIGSAPEFVPKLPGNTFAGGTTVAITSDVLTTAVTWPVIANVAAYQLSGAQYVRNAGSLTLANGVVLTGSDLLVSDNGTGGKIAASGVTFSNRLFVYGPGTASLSGDTFNNYAQFQLYDGGGGTTLSGNTFKGGIGSAPEFVPKLPGNTFAGGTTVAITSDVLTTAVTWPVIPNVAAYQLSGTQYVRNAGSLTLANGVVLTGSGLLVSDNGTGGKITASGVTFSNQLFVYGPGTASLSGDTFNNYAEFRLYDGGAGTTLSGNTFKGGIGSAPEFVPKLPGNTFAGGTTVAITSDVLTTAVTWPVIPNVAAYQLSGAQYVRNAGSLTLANGVVLTGSGLLVSDNGTGGKITASGVTFSNRLFVYGPGTASLSGDTFNNYAQFQLYDGGGGTTLSGNTFKGGIGSAPEFVPKLPGNTFAGGTTVAITSDVLTTAVTWPVIANVAAYQLSGAQYVRNAGSLTLANGVVLTGSGLLVSDNGTGGKITARAVNFSSPLILGAGSAGIIAYDTFHGNDSLQIDGHSGVAVNNNDLSNATVDAIGSGGPINLRGNYWGTTSLSAIGNKVHDHADDPNLPTIDYSSPLAVQPTLPDLSATALTVPSGPWVAGQSLNVTYSIKNIAGAASAPASGVSFVLKNVSTGATRTLALVDVAPLSAGASTGTKSATLQLPAASDSFWSGSLPGNYQIVMKADATNDIVEQLENNNTRTSASVTVNKPASITGTVFEDSNSNGKRDTGEQGLPYWLVYLERRTVGWRTI